jgi:hypothetical protein
MSATSEQHSSPGLAGEGSIHSHSSCASCGEVSAEHDHDHEHGFELIEVLQSSLLCWPQRQSGSICGNRFIGSA